jgi:hypothetical protein
LVQSRSIKGGGRLFSGRESMLGGADIAFFLADNSGEPTKFHELLSLMKGYSGVWPIVKSLII